MGTCCTTNFSSSQEQDSISAKTLPNGVLRVPNNTGDVIVDLTKTSYNTFVELLLINRILINPNKSGINNADFSQLPPVTDKEKGILSSLKTYGIYKYLEQHYRDSHCSIIDTLFKNTIMRQYSNEYRDETTIEFENSYYFGQLWNQNDLIPQIFQYLSIEELNNCSIVSFVWLFHAFNINSLYQLKLYSLIEWEGKKENERYHLPLRVWQRFINTRRIVYENGKFLGIEGFDVKEPSKYFLKYFSSLQNIEKVHCEFESLKNNDIGFLKVLGTRSNKIESFYANFSDMLGYSITNIKNLPRLKLLNAKDVELASIQLPVIISNKCETLSFEPLTLNKRMCDALLNDSDLSGVKNITLRDIEFELETNLNNQSKVDSGSGDSGDRSDSSDSSDTNFTALTGAGARGGDGGKYNHSDYMAKQEEKSRICKLLGEKLTGIEEIDITGARNDTLMIWKELAPIIKKHNKNVNGCNTSVSFSVGYIDSETDRNEVLDYYTRMIKFIVDNKIGLKSARLGIDENSLDVTGKVLNTPQICQTIESLYMVFYASKYMGETEFEQFFNDYLYRPALSPSKRSKVNDNDNDNGNDNGQTIQDMCQMEKIQFDNLSCIQCYFTFTLIDDWQRVALMLTRKFNNNNNNDSNNKNKNKNNVIFWDLHINTQWPSIDEYNEKKMIQLFEYLNNIWFNVNQLYIMVSNPIDISVTFYRYHWGWHIRDHQLENANKQAKQMSEMYEKYGKKSFFKVFGDLAFEKKEDEDNPVIKVPSYRQPKTNKWCQPMEMASVWCNYEKLPLDDGGHVCRIHFVVRNAEHQREST